METAIRYQQDIATAAKASGDTELRRESRRNISALNNYYQKISEDANVPSRPERMGTYYGRTAVGTLKKSVDNGIIIPSTKVSGDGVNFICRIDKNIYSCVSARVTTDEVIITDERIEHSNLHDGAYDKYARFVPNALADPDYIFEDGKHPNTAMVIKGITDSNGDHLQIILRMKIQSDPEGYKNSIISCWNISQNRLENYKRNRKILYKKTGI